MQMQVEAYADVAPLLEKLAKALGKTKETVSRERETERARDRLRHRHRHRHR